MGLLLANCGWNCWRPMRRNIVSLVSVLTASLHHLLLLKPYCRYNIYRLLQLLCMICWRHPSTDVYSTSSSLPEHQQITMKPAVRLLLLMTMMFIHLNPASGQLLGEEVAEDIPGCPANCVCFQTTVRCMFLQLDAVPNVPDSTTTL